MSEQTAQQHLLEDAAGVEVVQIVGNSAYGGAVPVIFGIMDATATLGFKPTLLATHPDVVAAARAAGYEVWEFEGIVREPRPIRDLITAVRLAIALRRRKVRVVHTHTSKGGMVGRLAGWLARCDLVIHHTHGFYHAGLESGPRRTVMKAMERFFARMDDIQVFINSQEYAEAIEQGLVPARKARLMFNGVADPSAAGIDPESLLRQARVPRDVPVIGTVCRIDFEQKGLDTGVHAFEHYISQGGTGAWVVAGDGADKPAMEDMVARAGLKDRVFFLGHVAGAGALHGAFDVTFAPSRREGQSITVLEAMACGTSVVTTRIAGNVDLVDEGRTGLACPVDDIECLSSSLEALLGDPERRRSMGRLAREDYCEQFTPSAFEERVRNLYRDAWKEAR